MTVGGLLRGYGFSGFRSFASGRPERIGPLSKIHLLAGANNAGKSNALIVARNALPALRDDKPFELGGTDQPAGAPGDDGRRFRLAVAAVCSASEFERATISLEQPRLRGHLEEMLRKSGRLQGDALWFDYELLTKNGRLRWMPGREQAADLASADVGASDGGRRFQRTSRFLTQFTGDPPAMAARVLEALGASLGVRESIPKVTTISAFRQIGVDGDSSDSDEYSGADIIVRLARYQNPTVDRQRDRGRFEAINRFVQTLFDDEKTVLEVAHDGKSLAVFHNGLWLPLENYGTGLHQVVILAVAATVYSGRLLCIEEPEINLHPTLQRKLLRYLGEHTDNQYLIATHSAHLLDAERASISSVRRQSGATKVAPAVTPDELALIGAELGYRASDLIQANMVIWVEGPSDRLYLNHWIGALSEGLREGVHYSILSYGGKLLRHLTPEDRSVADFMALPRINRNFFVVIDSDRAAPRKRLNETKRRVIRQIQAGPESTSSWVTAGYTIENYVPAEILREAVALVHPRARCVWNGDRYVDPLASRQVVGRRAVVDKTAVARAAVASWADITTWPLDLKKQVRKLVRQIEQANESYQL